MNVEEAAKLIERKDWQSMMSTEETLEFAALEESIAHVKQALKVLSQRRGQLRNRLVMRLQWRKYAKAN